jgi:hypothetical protein
MVSLAHEGMALVAENTDIDWAHQNKLREQWLLDNPDAQYIGWMSI